jgi:hypothetical protein
MSKHSRKLTDEHKAYVIKRHAASHTAKSITHGLKAEFGITLSRDAVNFYHPVRRPRAGLAQRWKDLFAKEREAHIARMAHVGVTDKPARIRRRVAMMHRQWAAGRHALANEILDSVAMEIGDTFGRKRRR